MIVVIVLAYHSLVWNHLTLSFKLFVPQHFILLIIDKILLLYNKQNAMILLSTSISA